MSFRLKTILGIASIQLVLLFILIIGVLGHLDDSNERQMQERALTTASLFATATKDAVIATDLASIESFVSEVLKNPGLVYARVFDDRNRVLAQAGDRTALERPFSADKSVVAASNGIFDTKQTIEESGIPYGRIEIGLDITSLLDVHSEARQQSITIALLEMLLVALFSFVLGSYLTRQLSGLVSGSEAISNGKFGTQIPLHGKDELAHTVAAFNRMSLWLQEDRERFEGILRSALDCIISFDGSRRVVEVHPSVVFGYPRESLLGKSLSQTFLTEGQEILERVLDTYLVSGVLPPGSEQIEVIATQADGQELSLEINISGNLSTEHKRLVLYLTDISERKVQEQIKERITRDLLSTRARLEQEAKEREMLIAELESKNAELERFTYSVSHDLKSPLVTVQGFLGLLEQDIKQGDTQRIEQDMQQIRDAAEKMQRLLAELLELSRIGRIMNPPEAVSLDDLLQEAQQLLVGQIAEAGARIVVGNKLPIVQGDRQRLLEVVQNLLDNAIKFSVPQGDSRIEVSSWQQDGQAVCSITDNGIGIASAYQERIFGLFERLDPSIEGSGVGLALVKRIIEVHGGRIWVESAGPGKGSTFCFSLALKPGDAPHINERRRITLDRRTNG